MKNGAVQIPLQLTPAICPTPKFAFTLSFIPYASAVCFTRFSPFATAGIQMMITVITPSTSR